MPQPSYNPWGTPVFPDHAAFGTGSPQETSTQPAGLHTFMTGLYNGLENLARRAMGNSQSALDTGTYNPRPALEAALMPMGTGAIAGVPVKGAETVMGAGLIRGVKAVPKDLPDVPQGGGIKAYHGSPHDFDRFDISKIGSGEGAQAYGHGLYFAENEGVARSYRDALKWKGTDWDNPEFVGSYWLNHFGGDRQKTTDYLESALRQNSQMKSFNGNPEIVGALDLLKKGAPLTKQSPNPGKMYEVNLNADPAHFLDWDKPLKEQPRAAKLLQDFYPGLDPAHMDVSDLRNALRTETIAKDAAAAGIPGIKYLDQGSRLPRSIADLEAQAARAETQLAQWNRLTNDKLQPQMVKSFTDELADLKGQIAAAKATPQSHNYVMFDDKLIDILRKYGIAGMTAPPIFAHAMSEQKQ